MSEQHYLDQTDRFGEPMSEHCSPTAQPPTTTYPEPPYSVTTFNQSHQSDPHLLTPVSVVGSPSIQDSAKIMQHHPSTTASMYHSSPACWSSTFDMRAPHSQAPSPLPAMPESHYEQSYIKDEPAMAEPPAPYFGSYGVSEQHESDQGSLSPQIHNHFYSVAARSSMFEPTPMMAGPDLAMAHQHAFAPSHQYSLAPQPLSYPSNSLSDNRSAIARKPSQGLPYPSQQLNRPVVDPREDKRDIPPRMRKAARMRNRHGEAPKSPSPPPTANLSPPINNQSSGLVFKPNCPPQERWLFERRNELNTQVGGGIWNTIVDEYNAKFHEASDVPRLQMKLTRGRTPYLQWPRSDDEILGQSIAFVESHYYKMVTDKFRELGGGKDAHWGLQDIEARTVELGWTCNNYDAAPMDTNMKIRRRRKLSVRRQTAVVNQTPEMSEQERAKLMEDVYATRDIDPECEEEEEVTARQMRSMRIHQAQTKSTARGTKQQKQQQQQQGAQEELLASNGRVTRTQRQPTTRTMGKARVQRSRAA